LSGMGTAFLGSVGCMTGIEGGYEKMNFGRGGLLCVIELQQSMEIINMFEKRTPVTCLEVF